MGLASKKEFKIFLTFFIICAIFADYINWNENSRLDLTMAIVDEHRFEIDSYYNNTGDRAVCNGHYYSDKAPGMSFLAAPVYFAYEQIFGEPYLHQNLYNLSVSRTYLLLMFFVTVLTSSLFGALSVVLVYRISRYFTKEERYRDWLVVTYGLGTVALIYSRLFFGHVTAAFFSFLAFYLIFKSRMQKKDYSILAGLAGGLAVLVEYTALAIALACVMMLVVQRRWKPALKFFLGLSVFLVLLLGYQHSIYGHWFTTGYSSTNIDQKVWGDQNQRLAQHFREAGDTSWYYHFLAMQTKDESMCEKVVNEEIRDTCLNKIASLRKNLSICASMRSRDFSLLCRATITRDGRLCRNISSFWFGGDCLAINDRRWSLVPLLHERAANFRLQHPVNVGVALRLLFFPYKGLFFYSPILLFSLFGLGSMFRRHKPEAITILSIFLALILFNSSIFLWSGGSSFGLRHLTLTMPFLMIPLMFSLKKFKKILVPVIILSITLTSVGLQVAYEPNDFHVTNFADSLSFFWQNFENLVIHGPQSVLIGRILFDSAPLFPYSSLVLLISLVCFVWRNEIIPWLKMKKSIFLTVLFSIVVLVLLVNLLVWLKPINFYPLYREVNMNGEGWYERETLDVGLYPLSTGSWMPTTAYFTIYNAKSKNAPVRLKLTVKSFLNKERTLSILLNSKIAETLEVTGPAVRVVNLNLTHGQNKVTLLANGCESPAELNISRDSRCISLFIGNPEIEK